MLLIISNEVAIVVAGNIKWHTTPVKIPAPTIIAGAVITDSP